MNRSRIAAVLLGACLTLSGGSLRAAVDGARAPDFALKSLSGENLRLSEYRGQVVLIGFWASWCPQCPATLDGLAELRRELDAPSLQVFAISLDHDRGRALEVAGAQPLGFPVLLDSEREVARSYAAARIPSLVLIDRDGVIRQVVDNDDDIRSRGWADTLRELLAQ